MIRILLIDDHEIVREGLMTLLAEEAEIEVVGQAANGKQGIQMARELQPDVILLDLLMPE
ncbi:partial Transcriptional regulatory protein LiaR, partial [Anaerolineae bacterium]